MMKNMQKAVYAALSATPVKKNLKSHAAIVLERIARGGGRTEWYFCRDQKSLNRVGQYFLPGSTVSFFFDQRIYNEPYSQRVELKLRDMLQATKEILIGTVDTYKIDMSIVCGPQDLEDLLSTLSNGTHIFYGVFPAADNDGINAVTLTIPDADGIIRAHPH